MSVAAVAERATAYGEFSAATGVEPCGEPHRFRACIHPGWLGPPGANGGYLAAITLRALSHAVGDSRRAPRSLTVRYLSAAREGELTLDCSIDRSGRSVTNVSAQLEQHGRRVATATAAYCTERESAFELDDIPAPELAAPEDLPAFETRAWPAVLQNFEFRIPPELEPLAGRPDARIGGWARSLTASGPLDEPLIVAFADAWPPAALAAVRSAGDFILPTLDLTVHFRRRPSSYDAAGFVQAQFESRLSAEGFIEEDGSIWSTDGQLLAQSRQLAVVVPVPPSI